MHKKVKHNSSHEPDKDGYSEDVNIITCNEQQEAWIMHAIVYNTFNQSHMSVFCWEEYSYNHHIFVIIKRSKTNINFMYTTFIDI